MTHRGFPVVVQGHPIRTEAPISAELRGRRLAGGHRRTTVLGPWSPQLPEDDGVRLPHRSCPRRAERSELLAGYALLDAHRDAERLVSGRSSELPYRANRVSARTPATRAPGPGAEVRHASWGRVRRRWSTASHLR